MMTYGDFSYAFYNEATKALTLKYHMPFNVGWWLPVKILFGKPRLRYRWGPAWRLW